MWVNNASFLDLQQGNPGAACRRIVAHLGRLRDLGDPTHTIYTAETFSVAVGYSHPRICARLRGATARARSAEGVPVKPGDAASPTRSSPPSGNWSPPRSGSRSSWRGRPRTSWT